ncbi:DnaJ protein [Plasmodium gonderi]|uniref:DnaJ protein n=1 Tax=Plasmodium gonderi TaxID=77519 RepID=A0A1Y1JM30_PLAGO|nr:DnaJ protein [Plasmodium gonderi]GAW83280.1 DnaJ protein [Plasmodium gonderi]
MREPTSREKKEKDVSEYLSNMGSNMEANVDADVDIETDAGACEKGLTGEGDIQKDEEKCKDFRNEENIGKMNKTSNGRSGSNGVHGKDVNDDDTHGEKCMAPNVDTSENVSLNELKNMDMGRREKEEINELCEDELNEMFDDFLKDIENISSNKDNEQERKKINKGDAQSEITRLLANKNSSPFEIFDIHEDINMEEIKSKYRRLSVLIHPDKCKIEKANEAFHILNKAYEELKRDDIKEQYKSVYETAKKNIIKKLNLKKKKNELNEYLNKKEEEYEITKEIQLLINEECEILLKVQKEKLEYAEKCKQANLQYARDKEEEKLKEELKKEEERKLWMQGRDERVNSWKNYKKDNLKTEKEFLIYKNVGKKKEERTEEEKEQLKKLPATSRIESDVQKKRRKN